MLLLSSVWFGAVQRSAAQSQRGGDVEAGDITRLAHWHTDTLEGDITRLTHWHTDTLEGDITRLTHFTATWRKTSMTVLHQSQLIGDHFCTKVY